MKYLLLLSLLVQFGCNKASESSKTPDAPLVEKSNYELVLMDARAPNRPFTIDIDPSNTEGVGALEAYFQNGKVMTLDNGDPQVGLVSGMIRKVSPSQKHAWSFEFDPKTVVFTDMSMELCDASLNYVEENLDSWMKDVGRFCPWSTQSLVVQIKKGDKILYRRSAPPTGY